MPDTADLGMFDVGTTVVGVAGMVFLLFWLVGHSVDIGCVNPRACLALCGVSPDDNRMPIWVDKVLFAPYPRLRFYDWSNLSQLKPVEWERLHEAIQDFYLQISCVAVGVDADADSATVDDVVFRLASLSVTTLHEFQATVSVLLLMIYDPDIFNSYDRFKAYNNKLKVHSDRFTAFENTRVT